MVRVTPAAMVKEQEPHQLALEVRAVQVVLELTV
jgi:hypothetical protein